MDQFDSFLDDGDDDLFNQLTLPPEPSQGTGSGEDQQAQAVIEANPNRRVLGGDKDKHAYDDNGFGNFSDFVKHKRIKLHNQRTEDVRDLASTEFDKQLVQKQIFK